MLPSPWEPECLLVNTIPPPLADRSLLQKKSHQPKRKKSIEAHLFIAGMRIYRIRFSYQLRNHKTTRFPFWTDKAHINVIPIQQCEKIAEIIASNPCAAGGLPRVEYRNAVFLMNIRLECVWPNVQFITVHTRDVSVFGGNKGQRT